MFSKGLTHDRFNQRFISTEDCGAEISEGGVKVTFDDGKSVVFSSFFPYQIYLEAQKLQEFQGVH